MVPITCENKSAGCSRVFSSRYGMILHMRVCSYIGSLKKIIRKKQLYSKKGSDRQKKSFRLGCDEIAFKEHMHEVQLPPMDLQYPNLPSLTLITNEIVKKNDDLTKNLMLLLSRIGRRSGGKDVDSVVNILRNPSFKIESFKTSCTRYHDCVIAETVSMKKTLGSMGFRKVVIKESESAISCNLYVRSPISVLRKQIEGTSSKTTFFNPPSLAPDDAYCHPMMAELGTVGVQAVSDEIMRCGNTDAIWNNSSTGMEESFVGMFQIYSDKSRTSLKESSFQFYPLHLTLHNFSEEYRRYCIVNGDKFTAFLPIQFYNDDDESQYHSHKLNRLQKLKLLHLSTNYCLQELKDVAYSGSLCKDLEGTKRRCHPCLASYCAHIPESKDLTSVRNGNRIKRNCHRCLAETSSFCTYTKSESRNCVQMNKVIGRARELRERRKQNEAEQLMDE